MNFDRFAEWSADTVASARFFAFCIMLVVLWFPTYLLVGSFDTWQLLINTPTTIITFLLVALLQNSQRRFEEISDEQEDLLAAAVARLLVIADSGDEELVARLGASTGRGPSDT